MGHARTFLMFFFEKPTVAQKKEEHTSECVHPE